ncbi:glycosyltransferase [Paenibacillus rigui]|uniref:Family 2 glycosyl transferase n=1 Tax=Paenibacillus rigui TaxID=554312 RepID=A0A229USS5_9BACL|nr:glycosyltransferase [Paenibacillus rigui]OXM86444.1 family 2 glycosyl transferase [Paenibacillus rigui]
MLVSVCMIVRNEEAHLQRALDSIPQSFETVVVDTGSTDKSVEIASNAGACVSHFEWVNDFSAARNASINHANGKYILIMDADEELEEGTEQRVMEYIDRFPDQAGTVTIENFIKGESHLHRMVRFFPNTKQYTFQGKVHETVYKDGKVALIQDTCIRVKHYGYEQELYNKGAKTERYLKLYHDHLQQFPDDGYMLYQLGKLHYSNSQLQLALDALERCLHLNEQDHLYYPVMLVMLGYVLKEMGHSQLAEELLEPFIYRYKEFPDLFFLLGLLAMDTGKVGNIKTYFLEALRIGDTLKYTSVKGVGTFKAAYNVGLYYELTGHLTNARLYYQKAASLGYLPAINRLQNL